MLFSYDLVGSENEADVTLTITIKGKKYRAKDLHLEGDIGKVRPGRGKKIYWNILQDFPRGLHGSLEADLESGGGPIRGMVFVRGGCFDMGDTFGDGDSDEKPVHEVCVDDFYMGKYEVTQDEWKAVMGSNPSSFKDCGGRCPVEQVSWDDVKEFIKGLNRKTGMHYRLPTEAEWEYAARERGRRVRFGTGKDTIGPDEANFDASRIYKEPYSMVGIYREKTLPVGTFPPNSLGLFDMTGNVWELVSDWYDGDYYRKSKRDNPDGPRPGIIFGPSSRVIRGGSWGNGAKFVRAAARDGRFQTDPGYNVGFRLALSAEDVAR